MLGELSDSPDAASCRDLRAADGDAGSIQPFSVPAVGEPSWAYRITGSGEVPAWQWVEVILTSRYVIEVRSPAQAATSGVDPGKLLPRIAEAAHARAETALR
jgi:hypothetical protein